MNPFLIFFLSFFIIYFYILVYIIRTSYRRSLYGDSGFPSGTSGKESTCQCRRHKRHGFNPWIRKILWRREWQPMPIFLPGESHGQRSLVNYSPWDCKESDMTEQLTLSLSLPWKESYDKPRQHIRKQRHHFADKGRIVKTMVFPVNVKV